MLDSNNTHNFGPILERTLKVIRQNVLQIFRDLNIDITTEQWVILDSLHQQDGQSQTDLAKSNFKDAPTLSRIIDLMCKKGMTERQRSKEDRRSFNIFLTQKGKEIHQKAYPQILDLRNKGWNNLTNKDFMTFQRLMDQIYQNFEEK